MLLFQLHATDLPQALAKHKCINTVTIPATSVKHAVLFTVPKESLHLGEYFLLPSKKAPNPQKPSIRDTGKKYLFLVGFDFVFCFFFFVVFSFFFKLRMNIHLVSSQAENFGPAEQVSLFRCSLAICKQSSSEYILARKLSLLWMMEFFDSLYCANILAGGRHAEDKPFDLSESPTSCNLVFQVCKRIQLLVTLRSSPLLLYFKQQRLPCFSMCCFTFPQEKERLLEMITRWLH